METRWKPSVTVAAVIEHDGRFLLVEEHTPEGLKLNNPAGHLDPGESPQQAVVRETFEETACRFEPVALVGVYLSRFLRPATGEDVTYLRFAYAGTASDPEPGATLDHGIVRTLWMTLDEVRGSQARHRSALVMKCIEDFVGGKRFAFDVVSVDDSLYHPSIKA